MHRMLLIPLAWLCLCVTANAEPPPGAAALQAVVREVLQQDNAGIGLNVWATVVDRDGRVRAIAYTGRHRGDQMPATRTVSAQKAYTANAYSLPGIPISTPMLYSMSQPGGPVFGMLEGNPMNVSIVYGGNAVDYGTPNDPMVDKIVAGISVYAGGLPLYTEAGELIGALGIAGDVVCADHIIAWKVRHALKLDYLPEGTLDNIFYDISNGVSASGYGHPECSPKATAMARELPNRYPPRKR